MLLDKRIPISYIIGKIRPQLVYVFVISVVVHVFTSHIEMLLPEMPLTIPAFIGTAISILLSFKLNQSYDRWWEARKVWGSIVNDSRSLVMQVATLTGDDTDGALKKIAHRQIAWCYALGRSLRGQNPTENIEQYIDPADMELLERHNNKPLGLLQLQGADVKRLRDKNLLDTFAHIQIDNTLVRLCDAQGRAERIKTTVFPVTYRLFLHFMIYLFVITLSVSLKNVSWYFEMPLLLLISSSFFLLEKSATNMQNPFDDKPTDTAMTAIARTIEINIKQLLKEQEVPEPLTTDKFYLT